MIVTAYTTKRNSETPVRIHHHIIMNGGLDRDVVEDLWRKRRRKGQKKGDKIGFCNADRLQADENGIAALCTYLVKQGCGKKWERWMREKAVEFLAQPRKTVQPDERRQVQSPSNREVGERTPAP